MADTYSGNNRDEKLWAVGAGAGVGHAQRVRAVVSQRGVELILKFSSPDALSSHACACGVSCLDHKALHTGRIQTQHTMQSDEVLLLWPIRKLALITRWKMWLL